MAVPGAAQTAFRGAISGTVRDQSGAVVPSASVKATQTETNLIRTVLTGTDGGYAISNLPVGTYDIQVTLNGFEIWIKKGIALEVAANPQVDAVLRPGAVTGTVTVEAETSVSVETRETSVAQVIDSNLISELPLDGRNVVSLITLSGAALQDGTGSNKNYPGAVSIAVAGQQNSTVMYQVDGAYSNDPVQQQNMILPFPDALNQFTVQTGATGADTGFKSGAVVNSVTKSGTNHLHGNLFEFMRNYSVNALAFGTGISDSLKRNQFGGTLGGKIIRDKLFFFVGEQATINRQNPSVAANQIFVPTAQVLAGDFSTILSSACRTAPINLPAPFVGNKISPSAFNPISLKLISNLPAPSNACGATTYFSPNNSNQNQFIGRLDYNLSAKDTFYTRYLIDTYSLPPANDNFLQSAGASPGLDDRGQSAVIGYTHVISQQMVSSLNVSFTRQRITRQAWDMLKDVTPCNLGIKMTCFLDKWILLSVTGYFSYAGNSNNPGYFNSQNFGITENIQQTVRRHSLTYGLNILRTHLNGKAAFQGNGQFAFSGLVSGNGTASKGSALADFLLGNMATFTQLGPGQQVNSAGRGYAMFIQDYWRATPRLTITAGLRWEPFLPDTNKYGVDAIFDTSAFYGNVVSQTYKNAPPGWIYPGDPQSPGNQYTHSMWRLFTPRIGVAFDPTGNSIQSIRAGYNVIYDTLPIGWNTSYQSTNQPFGLQYVVNLPPSMANPWSSIAGGDPFATLSQRNPNFAFVPNAAWASFPLHEHPMYVQHWNVSYERRFGGKLLLSFEYLGNKAVHVRNGQGQNPDIYIPGNCPAGQYGLTAAGPCSNATTANMNARRLFALAEPYGANVGTIQYAGDGFNQNYHGLKLSMNRRFARGSSAVVNYTWSKCLTDGAGEQGIDLGSALSQTPFNHALDKGTCSSDRRQLLNASYVGQSPSVGNKFTKAAFGGWQAALTYQFQSGAPLTISSGTDTMYQGVTSRASLVAGCNPFLSSTSRSKYFNQSCFTTPDFGQVGNSAIGLLYGPSFWNVNLAITRFFPLPWEGKQLQFRAEGFNVLNHPNDGNPVTTLTSGTFGTITAYAGTARDMQFALKFSF